MAARKAIERRIPDYLYNMLTPLVDERAKEWAEQAKQLTEILRKHREKFDAKAVIREPWPLARPQSYGYANELGGGVTLCFKHHDRATSPTIVVETLKERK